MAHRHLHLAYLVELLRLPLGQLGWHGRLDDGKRLNSVQASYAVNFFFPNGCLVTMFGNSRIDETALVRPLLPELGYGDLLGFDDGVILNCDHLGFDLLNLLILTVIAASMVWGGISPVVDLVTSHGFAVVVDGDPDRLWVVHELLPVWMPWFLLWLLAWLHECRPLTVL